MVAFIRSLIAAAAKQDTEALDRMRERADDVTVRATLVNWIRSNPRDLFVWTAVDILAERTPWLGTDVRTRTELAERIRRAPDDPSTVDLVRELAEATVSESLEAWTDVVSLLRELAADSPAHAVALAVLVVDQDVVASGDVTVVEYLKNVINSANAPRDAHWWASFALGRMGDGQAIEGMLSAPHLDDDCRFVLLAGLDRAGCRSRLETFAAEGPPNGDLARLLLPAFAVGEDADSLIHGARTAPGIEHFSAMQRLMQRANLQAVR